MPSPTAFGPPACLLLDARGMHAVVLAHFVPPRSNEQSIPPIPVADRSALDLLPATPSLGANTRGFLASRVRRRNGHVYGRSPAGGRDDVAAVPARPGHRDPGRRLFVSARRC